jgi:hypothetical protein
MQQDRKFERKPIGTRRKRARKKETEMYYIPIPKSEVQSQETPIFFGQKYTEHFISHMAKVLEPSTKK